MDKADTPKAMPEKEEVELREGEDYLQETEDPAEELIENEAVENSRRLNQLYDYGLTPLQAKTLIGLLQFGPSKAKDLSRTLNLNRVDVYRILNALKKRGLLEVTLDNPNLFSAVPPNQMLMVLLEEEEERFRRLRMDAKDLLAWLKGLKMKSYARAADELSPSPIFKMQFGRQLVETWRKMLAQAEHDVVAVWSGYGLTYQSERGFLEPYISCVERGIDVRVISNIDETNIQHAKRYGKVVNLMHNPASVSSLRYLIIDEQQTSISTSVTPVAVSNEPSSIWTDSRAFIDVLRKEFEQLWKGGMTLAKRVEELEYEASASEKTVSIDSQHDSSLT